MLWIVLEQAQHTAQLTQTPGQPGGPDRISVTAPVQLARQFEQYGYRLRRIEIIVHCLPESG